MTSHSIFGGGCVTESGWGIYSQDNIPSVNGTETARAGQVGVIRLIQNLRDSDRNVDKNSPGSEELSVTPDTLPKAFGSYFDYVGVKWREEPIFTPSSSRSWISRCHGLSVSAHRMRKSELARWSLADHDRYRRG